MIVEQKVIVLTGGTSGIGREIVDQLAQHNQLVVIARNADKLKNLVNTYPDIATYQCDLANLTEVTNTARLIAKDYPVIDVLINNAAVQNAPLFLDEDFKLEDISREINTNLTSVCILIYLLLPRLKHKSRQGIILNINSVLAITPKKSSAVYCATKAGLNILSQSLQYQFGCNNVQVLQVFLPLVETAMTQGRGTGKISPQQAVKGILKGLTREVPKHYVGKAKLLRLIYRLSPALAKRILKSS